MKLLKYNNNNHNMRKWKNKILINYKLNAIIIILYILYECGFKCKTIKMKTRNEYLRFDSFFQKIYEKMFSKKNIYIKIWFYLYYDFDFLFF